MFRELTLFGEKFKYIMVYGHIRPTIGGGCRRKTGEERYNENTRNYIIDDGTGVMTVKYSHKTVKYSGSLSKSVRSQDPYIS